MAPRIPGPHEVIYVRVPPEDKARLRVIADRDFGGSLAAAVRYLLESYAGGKTRKHPFVGPPRIAKGDFLDDD